MKIGVPKCKFKFVDAFPCKCKFLGTFISYQAPCRSGQKWVCRRRREGGTRIARCRGGEGEVGEEGAGCKCRPGEVFGWRYATLDQGEVDMQKRFLKKHLELGNLKRLRPKFLKTLPGPQQVTRICTIFENCICTIFGNCIFTICRNCICRSRRGAGGA